MKIFLNTTTKLFLPLIIYLLFSQSVFSNGIIDESDIPDPEVVYDIPEEYLGEFAHVHPRSLRRLTVYESNKWDLSAPAGNYNFDTQYGHVLIDENNTIILKSLTDGPFIGDEAVCVNENGYLNIYDNSVVLNFAKKIKHKSIFMKTAYFGQSMKVEEFVYDKNGVEQVYYSEVFNLENAELLERVNYTELKISINGEITIYEITKLDMAPPWELGNLEQYFFNGAVIQYDGKQKKGRIKIDSGQGNYYFKNNEITFYYFEDRIVIEYQYYVDALGLKNIRNITADDPVNFNPVGKTAYRRIFFNKVGSFHDLEARHFLVE